MSGQQLTVSQLNLYLKTLLETDVLTHDIWIIGEITSVKHYRLGGQTYLTLCEGDSQLNAIIFESFLSNIKCPLKVGTLIRARGKVRFFQKRGSVSFQIAFAEAAGVGKLGESFEQLKAKLTAAGYFDLARKRPLPAFPEHIAVISSPDSAGFIDFQTILHALAPSIRITLIPAVMQGENCQPSMIKAFNHAHTLPVDLVAIIRGGGSSEDLAWFNNEAIVQAIVQSPTPVLSAIGHEIDFTFSDFAADCRAATPSDAAKLIGQPFQNAQHHIKMLLDQAHICINHRLSNSITTVHTYLECAQSGIRHRFSTCQNTLRFLIHRASQGNPAFRLAQGYAICRTATHQRIIRCIQDVHSNDTIWIEVSDGQFAATVSSFNNHENTKHTQPA